MRLFVERDALRYANKLIPDRGLALSAFDILTAEDGKVTWGNGLMYYKGLDHPDVHRDVMGSLLDVSSVVPLDAFRTFCRGSDSWQSLVNEQVVHTRRVWYESVDALGPSYSLVVVSLGFFRDIYIIPSLLPPNSAL